MTAVRPPRLTRRGHRLVAAVRTARQWATAIGAAAAFVLMPALTATWS